MDITDVTLTETSEASLGVIDPDPLLRSSATANASTALGSSSMGNGSGQVGGERPVLGLYASKTVGSGASSPGADWNKAN